MWNDYFIIKVFQLYLSAIQKIRSNGREKFDSKKQKNSKSRKVYKMLEKESRIHSKHKKFTK